MFVLENHSLKTNYIFSYIDTVWVCKFRFLTGPMIYLKDILNYKVRIFYVIVILLKFVFFENSKNDP